MLNWHKNWQNRSICKLQRENELEVFNVWLWERITIWHLSHLSLQTSARVEIDGIEERNDHFMHV